MKTVEFELPEATASRLEDAAQKIGVSAEDLVRISVEEKLARLDENTTIARKAAALGHSLISNHPFIDGNKRVGHAAMEVMLLLNGHEIVASVDDQEKVIINVASGTLSRDQFASWIEQRVVECPDAAT